MGDFAIHLDTHFKKLINNRPIKKECNNFELYFEYDEIDELVQKLSCEKIEFVHELREQPWRQKVVRIFDPDKNIIEIGESLEFLCYRLTKEGFTTKEVAEITSLPLVKVEEFILLF